MLFPSFKALLINLFLYFGFFVLLYISGGIFDLEILQRLACEGMMISGTGIVIYAVTNLIKACGLDFYIMRFVGFIAILAAPIKCLPYSANGTFYETFMTVYALCAYGISAYLYIREMGRLNRLEEAYNPRLNEIAMSKTHEARQPQQPKVLLKRTNTPPRPRRLIIPGKNTAQPKPTLQAANA